MRVSAHESKMGKLRNNVEHSIYAELARLETITFWSNVINASTLFKAGF